MSEYIDWQIAVTPAAEPGTGPSGPVVAHFTCAAESAGWSYSGVIVRGAKGIAVSRVVTDSVEDKGVTLRAARSFPVGAVLAHARSILRWPIPSVPPTPAPTPCSCGCLLHREGAQRGYAVLSDRFLREVATAFIEEAGAERDGSALQRMSLRFGRPSGTVRGWIARARRDGYLAPGVQGRRGGPDPGPRLLVDEQHA